MPDLETLAIDCLARMEADGDGALERVCREHPEHATAIREMVDELRRVGLMAAVRPQSRRFGEFDILAELGGGGMGVVYLAEQKRLGRRVALKVVRDGIGFDQRGRERFRREIEAASRLDHPGICTVYEAGDVDGVPYFAMRHVDGDSLAACVGRWQRERVAGDASSTSRGDEAQRLQQVVRWIESVARALHAAHETGIVHRDVKPANVVIDRTAGEPVIIDFGLARALDSAQPNLTVSGAPIGTPAYMAPEQLAGEVTDVRTDVYGLGATLFECVTLEPPFAGATRDALYRRIRAVEAPDARLANRHVGAELAAVIQRALEKDPRDRFATALDLAEELARIREHRPLLTRPPGPAGRIVRWCRRNPPAVRLIGAIALGLVVALVLLRQSRLAQTEMRALAIAIKADEVRSKDPELAFKLIREALGLDDGPAIRGRAQETMFALPPSTVVRRVAGQLTRVAFSRDGQFFAVAGSDVEPTVHRGRDGALLATLPHRHPDQRTPLSFSRDGRELAVADAGGVVHVYALGEGGVRKDRELAPAFDGASVISIDHAPIGAGVVVAYGDGRAALWRDGKTAPILLPGPPDGGYWPAAFLPDDRVVAAGSLWTSEGRWLRQLEGVAAAKVVAVGHDRFAAGFDGGVALWSLDGELVRLFPGRRDPRQFLAGLAFDPASDTIAITINKRVETHDRDGRLCDVIPVGGSVDFASDGRRLATASAFGLVQIWRHGEAAMQTGVSVRDLAGHQGDVFAIAWAPDAQHLVSVSFDGTARLWDVDAPGHRIHTGHGWVHTTLAVDRERVVFSSETGAAIVCDRTGRVLTRVPIGAGLAIPRTSPDGETVYVTCGERLTVLAARDGAVPARHALPDGGAFYALPLADGRFAVLDHGYRLWSWNPDAGERTRIGVTEVSAIEVLDEGVLLAIGTWQGEVRLWNAIEDRTVWHSAHTTGLVWSVRESPDKRHLLVASQDTNIYLWSLEASGELVRTYRGHQNRVTHASFSPNGRRIVSCGGGTVRVWDKDSGEELHRFAHGPEARSVWFLDEDTVVSSGIDGTVRWWLLDRDAVREALDAVELDELTVAERTRFADVLGR